MILLGESTAGSLLSQLCSPDESQFRSLYHEKHVQVKRQGFHAGYPIVESRLLILLLVEYFNLFALQFVVNLQQNGKRSSTGGIPLTASGGSRGGVPRVQWNPPFGLDQVLRSTDDRPYGIPLSG